MHWSVTRAMRARQDAENALAIVRMRNRLETPGDVGGDGGDGGAGLQVGDGAQPPAPTVPVAEDQAALNNSADSVVDSQANLVRAAQLNSFCEPVPAEKTNQMKKVKDFIGASAVSYTRLDGTFGVAYGAMPKGAIPLKNLKEDSSLILTRSQDSLPEV